MDADNLARTGASGVVFDAPDGPGALDGAPLGPVGSGRRVASNAAWTMTAELVGKVASFALVVVLARQLGARQYGYFSFGLAFIPLFLQLARWGIDTSTIRSVAAAPTDGRAFSEAVVNGLAARATLAVLGLAVSLALCPLFVHGRDPLLAVAIIGVALLVDEMRTFIAAVFIAFERMRFNAMALLVNRIFSTLLAVVAVAIGGGLVLVCVTYLIGSLTALATAAVNYKRLMPKARRQDLTGAVVRRVLRDGAPYGVATFLNMAAFRVDSVILEVIKGPVAVGIYNVAYRFFEPLLFITWGLAQAVFPRLVSEHAHGRRTRTFPLGLAGVLAGYMPVAVGAPFVGRWLLVGLFSSRYQQATHAVVLLTTASVFYGVAHLSRMALIATERRREIVWVAAAALAVNVVVNLAVIPRWSYTGAAAATLATEVLEATVLVAMCVWAVGRHGDGQTDWRPVAVPVVAAAAMGAVLLLGGFRGPTALGVGTVVYVVALAAAAWAIAPTDARWVRDRLAHR